MSMTFFLCVYVMPPYARATMPMMISTTPIHPVDFILHPPQAAGILLCSFPLLFRALFKDV
jgi:hypothetical protein